MFTMHLQHIFQKVKPYHSKSINNSGRIAWFMAPVDTLESDAALGNGIQCKVQFFCCQHVSVQISEVSKS